VTIWARRIRGSFNEEPKGYYVMRGLIFFATSIFLFGCASETTGGLEEANEAAGSKVRIYLENNTSGRRTIEPVVAEYLSPGGECREWVNERMGVEVPRSERVVPHQVGVGTGELVIAFPERISVDGCDLVFAVLLVRVVDGSTGSVANLSFTSSSIERAPVRVGCTSDKSRNLEVCVETDRIRRRSRIDYSAVLEIKE
jgi:hypothetical protein